MAFFSTPGIERLYSGVKNSTPFDFCSFSRNASQSAGGAASRSWLKKEMPCKVVTSSFSEAGASLASAWAILSEKLSLRRLPTIATTLWVAMGFPSGSRNGCLHLAASEERCKCMNRAISETQRLQRPRIATGSSGRPWDGLLHHVRHRPSALVRVDQKFLAGGALAVDGDVAKLQRFLQRHHLRVIAGEGGLEFSNDPCTQFCAIGLAYFHQERKQPPAADRPGHAERAVQLH